MDVNVPVVNLHFDRSNLFTENWFGGTSCNRAAIDFLVSLVASFNSL